MQQGYFDAEKAYKELKERYNIAFVGLFIQNGFKVYLFGGSLRDMVMGKGWKDADLRAWIPLPPKERDKKTEEVLAKANLDIKTKIIFNETFTIYRFLPENSPAGGVIDFTVVSDQWVVGPDFNINGLYFDLETKELIDRHNSVSDIEKRLIRTAKDPMMQFKDEPQMIFRAIKCACQFNFALEDATFKAVKNRVPLAEGILAAVADDSISGMTEWFIGNIFRGLKYNPSLFVKLWNDTGITAVFNHFVSKRLGLSPGANTLSEKIFDEGKRYGYEEALNIFISAVARAVDYQNPKKTFEKIIRLFRMNLPSVYGDFVVDNSKIVYSE